MTGARTRDSRDCIVLKELAPSRISIKELSKRVWKEIDVDNVPGLAAQTSYYFVLALFPFRASGRSPSPRSGAETPEGDSE